MEQQQQQKDSFYPVCSAIWMEIENKHGNCQLWHFWCVALGDKQICHVILWWKVSSNWHCRSLSMSFVWNLIYLDNKLLHTHFPMLIYKTHWTNHQHTSEFAWSSSIFSICSPHFSSFVFQSMKIVRYVYNLKRNTHTHTMHDNIRFIVHLRTVHPVFLHF